MTATKTKSEPTTATEEEGGKIIDIGPDMITFDGKLSYVFQWVRLLAKGTKTERKTLASRLRQWADDIESIK